MADSSIRVVNWTYRCDDLTTFSNLVGFSKNILSTFSPLKDGATIQVSTVYLNTLFCLHPISKPYYNIKILFKATDSSRTKLKRKGQQGWRDVNKILETGKQVASKEWLRGQAWAAERRQEANRLAPQGSPLKGTRLGAPGTSQELGWELRGFTKSRGTPRSLLYPTRQASTSTENTLEEIKGSSGCWMNGENRQRLFFHCLCESWWPNCTSEAAG